MLLDSHDDSYRGQPPDYKGKYQQVAEENNILHGLRGAAENIILHYLGDDKFMKSYRGLAHMVLVHKVLVFMEQGLDWKNICVQTHSPIEGPLETPVHHSNIVLRGLSKGGGA